MTKKVVKVKQNVVADGIAGGGLNELFKRSAELEANTEPETFDNMYDTTGSYLNKTQKDLIYGIHIVSILFLAGVVVYNLK